MLYVDVSMVCQRDHLDAVGSRSRKPGCSV
jgi:hypothetical protein